MARQYFACKYVCRQYSLNLFLDTYLALMYFLPGFIINYVKMRIPIILNKQLRNFFSSTNSCHTINVTVDIVSWAIQIEDNFIWEWLIYFQVF